MLRAKLSRGRMQPIAMLLFGGLLLWTIRHILGILLVGSVGSYVYYYWFYLFSFAVLAITVGLSLLDRPKDYRKGTKEHEYITVIVPVYNEDVEVSKECLSSIINQSRTPDEIFVVDDGTTSANYSELQRWFYKQSHAKGILPVWHRKQNGGKRHAQAVAIEHTHSATIYVTVDSDSILDYVAIEELIKPFGDPDIQSVAGVVLAKNNRTNLLARFTDILFVTGQLIDRSMMSVMGSVLVNSGGLAAYRAQTVRDNLDVYLSETFFGRHIEFSDDSMLTLYSLHKGKTVQQPSAFVFTMMPDKLSHHIRQQIRWSKGSFIRSWWRLRYLPITSIGFLRQFSGWLQFAMSTTIAMLVAVVAPLTLGKVAPFMLLIPILVGYGQALRYFSIKRSDETFAQQFLTYLTTPVAVLWSYTVLRFIRIYAMFTVFKTKWGTRQSIEVTLGSNPGQVIATSTPMAYTLTTPSGWYGYYANLVSDSRYRLEDVLKAWMITYERLSVEDRRAVWQEFYSQCS